MSTSLEKCQLLSSKSRFLERNRYFSRDMRDVDISREMLTFLGSTNLENSTKVDISWHFSTKFEIHISVFLDISGEKLTFHVPQTVAITGVWEIVDYCLKFVVKLPFSMGNQWGDGLTKSSSVCRQSFVKLPRTGAGC